MDKDKLKKIKEATEKLTEWDSSKKVFGHFLILESNEIEKDDSLYEFWCLAMLLHDLATNYNVTLESETGTDQKIFPQKPAFKKGWAFFQITNKTDQSNIFQVCYGTKIKLSFAPNTTIAPDISIQKHDSSEDPNETMVELIIDAKYRKEIKNKKKKESSLTISELREFAQWVIDLESQNAKDISLTFNIFTDLKSNCLLTNGKAIVKHKAYCIYRNIKQVGNFDIDSTPNVIG